MSRKVTTDQFINKATKVHSGKYGYSKTKYIKAIEKVIITCPIHGDFYQSPNSHLSGRGCPLCGFEFVRNVKLLTTYDFIKKSEQINTHNEYNYDISKYVNAQTKIDIICNKHGKFSQLAKHHLRGHGCPKCNYPTGEIKIRSILEKYNINNEYQSRLDRSKYVFDFYLNNHDCYIEYQGIGHYKAIDFFGGKVQLEKIHKRDQHKRDWCKSNGHNLLEIKYTDFDNIEEILKKELNL